MFGLGPWEIGLFVLLVLMIFGAGKLPKIMGQVGEGMKTLRDSITYDPKK
jgi:sec-independent protein translocase protein TatA